MGDGDGRFLARLLAANPPLTADVVDSSHSMLRILDRRIRRAGPQARQRICLHHADALEWNPSGSYDLIVSHFFLDCFFPGQLEQLFDRCSSPSSPRRAMGDLGVRHSPESIRGLFRRRIIGLLYRAFGLITGLPVRALPDYAASLLPPRLCAQLTTTVIWLGSCAPSSGRSLLIPSQK